MLLKGYAALGLKSIQTRQDRHYWLWLVARSIDTTGGGWVLLRDLVKSSPFSQQTTRRLLKDKTFFTVSNGERVYLRGLVALALALDSPRDRLPVALPECETIADFRAALVAAWCSGRERTVAQGTLGRLTGRTGRTIRNYARRAESHKWLQTIPNAVVLDRDASGPVVPELAERGVYRAKIDGTLRLLRRLPNTYAGQLDCGAPGMLAHGSYKDACFSTRRATTIGEREPQGRRYFDNVTAYGRALRRLLPGESCYLATDTTDNRGARVWTGWYCESAALLDLANSHAVAA